VIPCFVQKNPKPKNKQKKKPTSNNIVWEDEKKRFNLDISHLTMLPQPPQMHSGSVFLFKAQYNWFFLSINVSVAFHLR